MRNVVGGNLVGLWEDYEAFVLTAPILAALAGCAPPPDKIAGVPNAGPGTQADRERLAVLTNQQSKAATGDALGVFLVGAPVASMSGGDHETEIAVLKGRCGPAKT